MRECHTNRLFCNKLWQATKFTKLWTGQVHEAGNLTNVDFASLPLMNKWILSRLSKTICTVNDALETYEFHVATKALKDFLYYDFCDVFLVSSSVWSEYETTLHNMRFCDSKMSLCGFFLSIADRRSVDSRMMQSPQSVLITKVHTFLNCSF